MRQHHHERQCVICGDVYICTDCGDGGNLTGVCEDCLNKEAEK